MGWEMCWYECHWQQRLHGALRRCSHRKTEEGWGETSVSHRWSSRGHGTEPVPAPLTHPLAALWHCGEVPASACGHVSVIQASGGEEERTLTPLHPFYELLMANTIDSSVDSLSAKDFKHCNVQHSNICKEAQSYQLLARLRWTHKNSPE